MWCDFFSFVSPSGDFTWHVHFWLQKIFSAELAGVIYKKKAYRYYF